MKKIDFVNGTTIDGAKTFNNMQSNVEEVFNGEEPMGSIVVEDVIGKNLFDKNSAIFSTNFINASALKIQASTPEDNNHLTYVKIEPNTTYTISKMAGKTFRIGTSAEIPVIGTTVNQTIVNHNGTSITVTTKENDNYLIIVLWSNNDTVTLREITDTIQVEKGSSVTEYTPYKKFGYNSQESMGEIVVDDITSSNLFNPNDIFAGKWLDDSGQPMTGNEKDILTNFIKVKPNTKYTISGFSSTEQYLIVGSYNSSKAFNSMLVPSQASSTQTVSFTTKATDEYIRCAFSDVNMGSETLQIEKGDATPYKPHEEYGYSSKKSMGKIVVDDISCKNKFNFDAITVPNGTVDYVNKTITVRTFANGTEQTLKQLCPDLEVGRTYALSFKTTGNSNFIHLFGTSTNWMNGTTHVITQEDLDNTIVVYGNYEADIDVVISEIQIELDKATPYTPYKNFNAPFFQDLTSEIVYNSAITATNKQFHLYKYGNVMFLQGFMSGISVTAGTTLFTIPTKYITVGAYDSLRFGFISGTEVIYVAINPDGTFVPKTDVTWIGGNGTWIIKDDVTETTSSVSTTSLEEEVV